MAAVGRVLDWRVWLGGLLLAVGILFAVQGGYNVHSQVTWDKDNRSNYPKCDNGDNRFLTTFFEWVNPKGQIIAGQFCTIAGVSMDVVDEWTKQELEETGIDPAEATANQVLRARDMALIRWAGRVIGR